MSSFTAWRRRLKVAGCNYFNHATIIVLHWNWAHSNCLFPVISTPLFPSNLFPYFPHFPLNLTSNLNTLSVLSPVSWGVLPGLWFDLSGAHCSGCRPQLPNHPCSYLLPDWPEEESHRLPVCIIPPCCFCLFTPPAPLTSTADHYHHSSLLPPPILLLLSCHSLNFRFPCPVGHPLLEVHFQ